MVGFYGFKRNEAAQQYLKSRHGLSPLGHIWGTEMEHMAWETATSNNHENEGLCDWCIAYVGICMIGSGFCTCGKTVRSCSCPPGAAPSPSCVFYSPRIQGLLNGERTEFETAEDHFTVTSVTSKAEAERVGEENHKYFDEVLVKHPEWGGFFAKFEDLELGAKIGEGGQAEIFAATSQSFIHPLYKTFKGLVAKVWKEGVSLRDLERQWPPQLLSNVAPGHCKWPFLEYVYGGTFIRDGEFKNRFAFVTERQWGDLRTLIDRRMFELVRNNFHGPPFCKIEYVYRLLNNVLYDLRGLHDAGIVHRDIKASNVLVRSLANRSISVLMDFECSLGIIGTGFWRAPEILEQLQKGVPAHEVVFTYKADIYSFGMLCYEVVTGFIPFEGHPSNDYSIVLRGERPKLPHDLDPKLRRVILYCWEHDPQLRPTASELYCDPLFRNFIDL